MNKKIIVISNISREKDTQVLILPFNFALKLDQIVLKLGKI